MDWFFTVLATGISSFVATNIDDIIILMLFFSQGKDKLHPRQVIIGQYLGFTALILASLPGFLGGLIVPQTWIGLLGFIPIAIGIKHWLSPEQEEDEIQTVPCVAEVPHKNRRIWTSLASILSAPTYNVAAVTMANGGDNIGIYVPLFASVNLLSFGIILGIFYLLIGVWCAIAYFLSCHPLLIKPLTRYGNNLVPFILVGLGIYILIESRTYQLLPMFSIN